MLKREEYLLIPPNCSFDDVLFVLDNNVECTGEGQGIFPEDDEYYKEDILIHGSVKRIKVTTIIEAIE